jgi:aldehyde dehydrogenase (NAD+)
LGGEAGCKALLFFVTVAVISVLSASLFQSYSETCAIFTAGNCVVLKPSEVSEHTAALLEKLLPQYLDKVCVVH